MASRFRRGMTVMELMVASVIIVILILAVGQSLSGLGQMVQGSQATMRANTKAAAMGDVLYLDIRRASQNGFLCITQAAGGSPQLYVLDMGPSACVSPSPGRNATGSISCMGQTSNSGGIPLVWHIAYVLNSTSGLPDSANFDTGALQSYTRATASSTIDSFISTYCPAPDAAVVTLPPDNLANLADMWKVLNTYATDLSIMWSDGTTDPNDQTRLVWYGINCNNGSWTVVNKDSAWATNTSASGKPEFAVGGLYRALFTHDEPNLWPAAIKIRFRLTDPDAPKDFDLGAGNGVYYEVISPVGQ